MRKRYSYYAVVNGNTRTFTTVKNRNNFIADDPCNRRRATQSEAMKAKYDRDNFTDHDNIQLNWG